VQVAKLHSLLGAMHSIYVEGLNWLEGVDQDHKDEILESNPMLVFLLKVEVEKIKVQYAGGAKLAITLEVYEDSLLYEEEYVLCHSKQPHRVPEDVVMKVNLGTVEELQPIKINNQNSNPLKLTIYYRGRTMIIW